MRGKQQLLYFQTEGYYRAENLWQNIYFAGLTAGGYKNPTGDVSWKQRIAIVVSPPPTPPPFLGRYILNCLLLAALFVNIFLYLFIPHNLSGFLQTTFI